MQRGFLRLPGSNVEIKLATCPLGGLGALGYDRRDIHDAFTVSHDDWSPYPAFWGHDAKAVTSIAQAPNARLLARSTPARGRRLKSATAVWERAGNVLLVERMRTNTHRVIATCFSEKVLGNTWWALDIERLDGSMQKALVLWLNSSFGALAFFSRRVTTEGAFVQMKKPAWESMPVLDVRSLSAAQTTTLADAYDNIAPKALAPLARLDADPVRREIDDVICATLRLPSLAPVRALLAREPGLTGRRFA